MSSLSTDGYQIVVGGSQSKVVSDMTIANIQVGSNPGHYLLVVLCVFFMLRIICPMVHFLLASFEYGKNCRKNKINLP